MSNDYDITLDFIAVHRAAERVRETLIELRKRHDLARFEYTKAVRISPTEIPHSHPKLTLNTWVRDELSLLATYLHEQMHWYLTWYSHARAAEWHEVFRLLRAKYPQVPDVTAGGAQDEFSTYLHLIVNWLEIEAGNQFVERERIVAHAEARPFYRWCYRTVIDDWKFLGAIYAQQRLVPIRLATDMSADELQLAALIADAPRPGK